MIDVQQEAIRHDHRVSDISMDLPLSVESALSVRSAAIAIRYHGVRYLPVVDDGRLVGIVAISEARDLGRAVIAPPGQTGDPQTPPPSLRQSTDAHLPEDRSRQSFRHATAVTTAGSAPTQEFP